MLDQILEVKNLETRFHTEQGTVHAVNGVSFTVDEGEVIGVVGESGCGKSVTMLSILRLVASPPGEISGGSVQFFGQDLLALKEEEMQHVRGAQISMIFQDPMTSLNPVLSIGKQLTEPMLLHLNITQEKADQRAAELLEMVGISNAADRLRDYPHQFSGGMRQRVMIAMALSCEPKVLIADEPTTALDVTIQAQFIDLVKRLQKNFGLSIIWITHDLGVIAGLADRMIVMYGGLFIEEAPVRELYGNPQHPYTMGLLGSLPRLDGRQSERLESIDGLPPVLYAPPSACPFAPRCKYVIDRCHQENPALEEVAPGHRVACWVDVNTGSSRL